MQTEMTTSERLRVVAEFCGYIVDDTFYTDLGNDTVHVMELGYHDDWNMLIEAVKKFVDANVSVKDIRQWHDELKRIESRILRFNISEAFIALSNAISWYNSLTK